MSDRELLLMIRDHYRLLNRIAVSSGPIKCNGKIAGVKKILATETEAALKILNARLYGLKR